jgi:hypothetical protein
MASTIQAGEFKWSGPAFAFPLFVIFLFFLSGEDVCRRAGG